MILECKPGASKIPSVPAIHYNYLPNMYEEIKERVLFDLNSCLRVATTCDGWQSKSNESYMGVTCHGITNNWKYVNFTLSLRYMDQAHTSVNIASELRTIVKNWTIDSKVNIH